MTPTLKAMVEAMKAEIAAQVAAQVADYEAGKWGADFAHFTPDSDISPDCQINGAIDLEKVARAGLKAVKTPTEDMLDAVDMLEASPTWYPDEPGERNSPTEIYTAMIDAILKDQP